MSDDRKSTKFEDLPFDVQDEVLHSTYRQTGAARLVTKTPIERTIATYRQCYENPNYKMCGRVEGQLRRFLATLDMGAIESGDWDFVDVGCGRGESLPIAEEYGFNRPMGMEIVPELIGDHDGLSVVDMPSLCKLWMTSHRLPPRWDVVTCLDVLEHLPDEGIGYALLNLWNLTERVLFLSIATNLDGFGPKMGLGHLHLTVKDPDWWAIRVREVTGCDARRTNVEGASVTFEVWRA